MRKIFFASIILALASCKDPVPGCTNRNAENYNMAAEEDDGTCSFRGGAVVYHDVATGQALVNAGVTNVRLFVDGTFMDSMSPNIGFSYVPSCDNADAMLMSNYGIGNSPSKTFQYQIKDQNNVVLSSGTFEIRGNECTAVKYEY
jgi:hypothetical protein